MIQGKENENLYLYNRDVIYTPNVYPKGRANDVVDKLYLQGGGGKILANDDKERELRRGFKCPSCL